MKRVVKSSMVLAALLCAGVTWGASPARDSLPELRGFYTDQSGAIHSVTGR